MLCFLAGVAVVLAALIVLAANHSTAKQDFALMDFQTGRTFRLREWQGGVVMLNFFCGCAECVEIGAEWERVRVNMKGWRTPLRVAGVTQLNRADALAFQRQAGFEFPFFFDVEGVSAEESCPAAWVVDSEGRVCFRQGPLGDARKFVRRLVAAARRVAN